MNSNRLFATQTLWNGLSCTSERRSMTSSCCRELALLPRGLKASNRAPIVSLKLAKTPWRLPLLQRIWRFRSMRCLSRMHRWCCDARMQLLDWLSRHKRIRLLLVPDAATQSVIIAVACFASFVIGTGKNSDSFYSPIPSTFNTPDLLIMICSFS